MRDPVHEKFRLLIRFFIANIFLFIWMTHVNSVLFSAEPTHWNAIQIFFPMIVMHHNSFECLYARIIIHPIHTIFNIKHSIVNLRDIRRVHPPFRRQKNSLPSLAGLIPYCRKKERFNRKSGGMKFFVGEMGRTPKSLPFPALQNFLKLRNARIKKCVIL